MDKYTIGKENEAQILWELIKNKSQKEIRIITNKLHNFNKEIKEIKESNLSNKTKIRILTEIWHRYKDNYISNYGYDSNNKVDTFFVCLIKIRYRKAYGYKNKIKEIK